MCGKTFELKKNVTTTVTVLAEIATNVQEDVVSRRRMGMVVIIIQNANQGIVKMVGFPILVRIREYFGFQSQPMHHQNKAQRALPVSIIGCLTKAHPFSILFFLTYARFACAHSQLFFSCNDKCMQ